MSQVYQICNRCVMDITDLNINFDENGYCNHCRDLIIRMKNVVNNDPNLLEEVVNKIKLAGKDKKYDCILGVSGGVNSTYLAYISKKLGLRILAVHLDNGWNSELAVKNIEQVLNKLNIDLYTNVLDWESFRDLQISFLESSTTDLEIPTDHAIHATLFKVARQLGVRYILQGMNIRTEGIMPRSWTYGAYDWTYIQSIHKKFGTKKLHNFPHFSLVDRLLNFFVFRLKVVSLLNLVDYNKNDATKLLTEELSWRDYEVKHGESIYTRFYQSYFLPTKFGIDKRKAHLSSLIVSNQISRTKALEILEEPSQSKKLMSEDREYVLKKLNLTEERFLELLNRPIKTFEDYPNQNRVIQALSLPIRIGRRLGIFSPTSGL